VDDCFFVATCDEEWITAQSSMLKDKYHEITVQRGDELGLVGMQVQMNCAQKMVTITQPKNVARVIECFGITKAAPNPAMANLMGEDDESPLLQNQKEYMSKCSMLMYLSQRTYPEICPAVGKSASKYNKASELDMKIAIRVAEYIYGTRDTHCLTLNLKTLNLISAADASYAEHP
jgi:hypothetical protein